MSPIHKENLQSFKAPEVEVLDTVKMHDVIVITKR